MSKRRDVMDRSAGVRRVIGACGLAVLAGVSMGDEKLYDNGNWNNMDIVGEGPNPFLVGTSDPKDGSTFNGIIVGWSPTGDDVVPQYNAVADDFTVPGTGAYRVTRVRVYAMERHFSATRHIPVMSNAGGAVRIWGEQPAGARIPDGFDLGGGTPADPRIVAGFMPASDNDEMIRVTPADVVFADPLGADGFSGDGAAGRNTWTGYTRQPTTASTADRRWSVMALDFDVAADPRFASPLEAGRAYWAEFSLIGNNQDVESVCPVNDDVRPGLPGVAVGAEVGSSSYAAMNDPSQAPGADPRIDLAFEVHGYFESEGPGAERMLYSNGSWNQRDRSGTLPVIPYAISDIGNTPGTVGTNFGFPADFEGGGNAAADTIAEDFDLAEDSVITRIRVFGYAAPDPVDLETLPPQRAIDRVAARVWNAAPTVQLAGDRTANPGAGIVAGTITTNAADAFPVMAEVIGDPLNGGPGRGTFTGYFRFDGSRPIFAHDVAVADMPEPYRSEFGSVLPAGTYWLEASLADGGTATSAWAFSSATGRGAQPLNRIGSLGTGGFSPLSGTFAFEVYGYPASDATRTEVLLYGNPLSAIERRTGDPSIAQAASPGFQIGSSSNPNMNVSGQAFTFAQANFVNAGVTNTGYASAGDDFSVPAGPNGETAFDLTRVRLYAYDFNNGSTGFPFDGAYVRVWSQKPALDDPATPENEGDPLTNAGFEDPRIAGGFIDFTAGASFPLPQVVANPLGSDGFTGAGAAGRNVYTGYQRVDASREVMAVDIDVTGNPAFEPLQTGRTYYVEVSIVNPGGARDAAWVTVNKDELLPTGFRGEGLFAANSNSDNLGAAGRYREFVDDAASTSRADLAFEIHGVYTDADLPCGQADLAEAFGSLDIFDILLFFELFGEGDPAADFAGASPELPGPDGNIDIFDILRFFNLFGLGC